MNILLTSVGRRTYVIDYFKEALGNSGKVFATNSSDTYTLSRADVSYISPIIYSDEYISFMLDLCKKEEIDIVLSLFDIDLPILAHNKQAFEDIGTLFIGPSYEAALIGNDKLRTYEFFKSVGLNTPRSYFDSEEVLSLLDQNQLTFPLVIKPRWGMGSISINIVSNVDELKVLYKKCRYEIENSYLKYESGADIDKAVVIQEFIKGQEYGLDLYKDLSGELVYMSAKKKIAMRSGETDIAEIVESKSFQNFVRIVAKNLDFTGVLDVDCFISGNRVYGLEINPRVSGSYPFSHIAGARYPAQLIKWFNGGGTDLNLLSAQIGVRGCKELVPVVMDSLSE